MKPSEPINYAAPTTYTPGGHCGLDLPKPITGCQCSVCKEPLPRITEGVHIGCFDRADGLVCYGCDEKGETCQA